MHIAGHYANCLVGMMSLCELANEGDILQNAKAVYKLLQIPAFCILPGHYANAQFRNCVIII